MSVCVFCDKAAYNPHAVMKSAAITGPRTKPLSPKSAMPGETFLMRHYCYDFAAFYLKDNRHLTLENIHVASAPGMGVLSSGRQHHWQILNCRIAPPAGSKRPCSTTAYYNYFFHDKFILNKGDYF